jgi:hypothetical protein
MGVDSGSHDEEQDVVRVDLKKEALDTPVDQFTMEVSKDPSGGGVLRMMWEKPRFRFRSRSRNSPNDFIISMLPDDRKLCFS